MVVLLKILAHRNIRVKGEESNVNKNKVDEWNAEPFQHLSFCSHGDSLLYPGVAAEQREHEASHIASPYAAAGAVRHKVSLMGEKLLCCERETHDERLRLRLNEKTLYQN